jgi:serine protease Do
MNQFKLRIVLLLFAALTVGGYFAYPKKATSPAYAQSAQESDVAFEQLRTATNLSDAFKHVAKALRPSVVSISTESKPQNVSVRQFKIPSVPFGMSPFGPDSLFEHFQSFEMPKQIPGKQGLGSGLVVKSDGHILTNHHVVKGAEKIEVTLSDNQTFQATVIGTDPETDLAVLKIDASGLQPVKWADSEQAEVGEWVVAIGSPFGLNQTVTTGIVSALGRDDMGITNYENFIQTDAAINPGNSGGPLVNLKGELLGINTAIASRSGAYNGIGFAIPSAMANRVMNGILDHGKVSRGYLGVMIQDLDEGLASSFGFVGKGVLIGDVVADGPAGKGGLQAGDIVTKLNETNVETVNQLRNRVADLAPDSTVNLEVVRNGAVINLEIVLGNRDATQLASWSRSRSGEAASASESSLGIAVQDLSDEIRQQTGTSVDGGVLVAEVNRSGLAWPAGIRTGDVIVSLNDNQVSSIADFKEEMASSDLRQGIRMRINREGASRFVFLRSN